MDQVKFVEDSLYKVQSDMVCLARPYPFKFFKSCLPQILLGPFLNTFTHMITSSSYDPNSKIKFNESKHIPSLSLSQIIHFNTVCERGNSEKLRHSSTRETPLSIYAAFLLHSQTRSCRR